MVAWRLFRYSVELNPISILSIKILLLVGYNYKPKPLSLSKITTFFKFAIRNSQIIYRLFDCTFHLFLCIFDGFPGNQKSQSLSGQGRIYANPEFMIQFVWPFHNYAST